MTDPIPEIEALWAELGKQRAHCRAYIDQTVPSGMPDLHERCLAELERQLAPVVQRLAAAEADMAVRKAKKFVGSSADEGSGD